MRRTVLALVLSVVAISLLAIATEAAAETWTLQLQRLEKQCPPVEYLRMSYPQYVVRQMPRGGKGGSPIMEDAAFKRIVTKEAAYKSDRPLRGVVKLGTQEFAFVIDVSEPEAKEQAVRKRSETKDVDNGEKKGTKATPKSGSSAAKPPKPMVGTLYFDFNHNGDLTDDKVVLGKGQEEVEDSEKSYLDVAFPRLDVINDADGTPVESAFYVRVRLRTLPGASVASVRFSAAAFRTGEITLQGKKHHVVLVDSNSNGRFDDPIMIGKYTHPSTGQVYLQPGDVLLIDPEHYIGKDGSRLYDTTNYEGQINISKWASIDGRCYDMKITPAGDKLTLEPSKAALGNITNPNKDFFALIHGDGGFLSIRGHDGIPVPVPEGEWRLFSYKITRPEVANPVEPARKDASGDTPSGAASKEASKSAVAARRRDSMAMGQATDKCKAVKVVKGETVVLPFGPPYRPIVTALSSGKSKEEGRLGLFVSLVGSGGENCTGFVCHGRRPPKPKFTITDPKGRVVQEGAFDYG